MEEQTLDGGCSCRAIRFRLRSRRLIVPDIHMYSTKLPWLPLPAGVPAVPDYYRAADHWPAESLARRERLRGAA